jgi:hypothetical protein
LFSCLQSLLKQLNQIFLSRQVSHLFQTLKSPLKKVKNGKVLSYYLLHTLLPDLYWLPNTHFNGAWMQWRRSLRAFQSNCKMRKSSEALCIPGALAVAHKGET